MEIINNNNKRQKYPNRRYIINGIGWLNKINQRRPSLVQIIKHVREKRKYLLIKLRNKKLSTFDNDLKRELINTRPLVNYKFYEYLNADKYKTVEMSTLFDKSNYLYYQFTEKSLKSYYYALCFVDKNFYNQSKIDNYCEKYNYSNYQNIPCKRYNYSICHYYNTDYRIFNIILFGGIQANNSNKYLNDLWVLNSKNRWVLLISGNNAANNDDNNTVELDKNKNPSPRKNANLFINNQNILTLMGGIDENGQVLKDCFVMLKRRTWKNLNIMYPQTYNKSNNFIVTNKNTVYNIQNNYMLHFRNDNYLSKRNNYQIEVWTHDHYFKNIDNLENSCDINWKCLDGGYGFKNNTAPALLKKKYLVYNEKLNIVVLFGINKLYKKQNIWVLNTNKVWQQVYLKDLNVELMNILYAYYDRQTKYIIVIYKKYKSIEQNFYVAYFEF